MKRIFIIIVCMFLLVGCRNRSEAYVVDAVRFKEEYELLNRDQEKEYRVLKIKEENPFIYKSAEDILEMIEDKESFVVYFGFSSCPWCRSVVPSLINAADEIGIDVVYYVDVKGIRDVLMMDSSGNVVTKQEGTDAYYKLLEKLDNLLEEYTLVDKAGNEIKTGEKRIYAPNIVSVVDGVPTEITDGVSVKQTDANMELTTEMEEESVDKIKCSIQCVVDSQKVCSAKTKC